ncbi:MAG: hypothetical protein IJA42_01175 [Bacteroidales bacterium]|nr:hypothetical protein [Bacteroidales bacterium]
MKKVLRNIYITIIVVGMVIGFSSMQCDPMAPTEIDFVVDNNMNVGVVIEIKYATDGPPSIFDYKRWTLTAHSTTRPDDYMTFYHKEYDSEDNISDISWDEAMMILKENIDTVVITRKSDAKTVLYCDSDNAMENEKYFFSQEAWRDHPNYSSHMEDKLLRNMYKFTITEELFE